MSNFGIFYDACSPSMPMSRDPGSKFRKKLIFPNSAFNIGRSCKISSRKALYFRSYQPKTSRGVENTPGAFRVKGRWPTSEGLLSDDVRDAMRLYRTSLNLCMILIFKKGSFGTGDSVVQNFFPRRLIEH